MPFDTTTDRALTLAADLRAWMYRNHPHAEPITVLAAFSAEMGAAIVRGMPHLTNVELIDLVQQVADILTMQIRASLYAKRHER